ncbi:hypothetical protein [Niabella drilacis]|uniref:Uncharacterized protein n=1 Tax=Niabella drilacis (strain DSM 25811 / CCM 8410 / CCUG 62505 / LMG 26954 / E90) TaxID=1285928 RepID=A0A1G6ZYA6_NIADE|nr:hypothetical protein [Niabella drilacis]SDE07481.1 hypothetical protein SAMN04487894_1209 [Niabella drilacis]
MKTRFLILALSFILSGTVDTLWGQTVSPSPNTLTQPVGSNTVSTELTRSSFGGLSLDDYSWSVTPSTGASISGGGFFDNTATLTFNQNAAAAPGGTLYTIKVTRNGQSASTTVTLYPSDFWAAFNDGDDTHEVHAFSISGGVYSAGPTTIFSPGRSFAALGRGPYPSIPTGYFYWIPNNGDNGVFSMYARNGNGSGPGQTIVNNYDVNGGGDNSDLGFVRLGVDKNGVSWIVASDGSKVYLVRVATDTNPFSTAPVTVVDNNVTLVGGTVATFQNGDVCLDGNGKLYILVNDGSGSTQIFTGVPNGASTTFTKQWNVLDANGNAFSGSVNGNCFDALGGMYLSADGNGTNSNPKDGIYYLDPSTIANSPAGSTIRAKLVHVASGYADLGTNIWPNSTPMPVTWGNITANRQNGQLVVNWQTATENNCKEYVVEGSRDNLNWTVIGKLDSKAVNGNSSTPLDYSLSISLPVAMAALGIGGLFLLTLVRSRRARVLAVVVIVLAVGACVKDGQAVDVEKGEVGYIRIAQYDKDSNTPHYSKVIKVVND